MLKLEMQNISQLKLTKKLNFLWFMTLTEVSKKKLKLNKLEKKQVKIKSKSLNQKNQFSNLSTIRLF